MPIEYQHTIGKVSEAAFRDVDFSVMGIAFDLHNEYGRLFDEELYSIEMENRLGSKGIEVLREFEILVSFETFKKRFYVDLLVGAGIPYELKVVDALTGAHHCQLLNYLFLLNAGLGKLVNFGADRVRGRFVSTSLSRADRRAPDLCQLGWDEASTCRPLLPVLTGLLNDWGTGLSLSLYREALLALVAQKETMEPVPLYRDGRSLGSRTVALLSETVMLHLTSIRTGIAEQERFLRRLLDLSDLEKAQWINLENSRVTLRSIS